MDGVLVVDKPEGLTSHDVVAAARRALRQPRIGHTGTLDPIATGVLPLACGRATRLVRFLSASDKEYDAAIRFGVATDTCDLTGREVTRSAVRPEREAVERALNSLSGEYLQTPPAYSAKKVAGERAYAMARRDQAVSLAPVAVTVTSAELLAFDGETAQVRLVCSAGFYVRVLAQALGERVGSAACLAALRRTRSGEFTLAGSVSLGDLVGTPEAAWRQAVPMERLLEGFPSLRLSREETRRVSHGQTVMDQATTGRLPAGPNEGRWVRLLDENGRLVALATAGAMPGSLHPAVVLI